MRPAHEYRHVFFDLDKTLTKSRTPMAEEHQALFDRLCTERDVVIITGGTAAQIQAQTTSRFNGRYVTMSESGNHALDKDGAELWYEPLSDTQLEAIRRAIDTLKRYFNLAVKDESDLIEERGAQVGYSVIGYHEDIEKKYAFDPGDVKRQKALKALPDMVHELDAAGVDVVPAGTTTFNFIPKGKDKGHNVARLIERMGWKKEDCIYVGDALFPGGNDESVMGVIDTKPVADPDDTFEFVAEILS